MSELGQVHQLFGVALPQGVLIGSTSSIDLHHGGPQVIAIIVAIKLSASAIIAQNVQRKRPKMLKRHKLLLFLLMKCILLFQFLPMTTSQLFTAPKGTISILSHTN